MKDFDWFLSHASIGKWDPGVYTLQLNYDEHIVIEIPDKEFEDLGFEDRARMLVALARSRASCTPVPCSSLLPDLPQSAVCTGSPEPPMIDVRTGKPFTNNPGEEKQ